MLNLLDLHCVAEDIIKFRPHFTDMLIKLLFTKLEGKDSYFDGGELYIAWDDIETDYYIEYNEDFYMIWAFLKFLSEADKQEIQDVLTNIRYSYIKYLIDVNKEFERYLGRIRGNRLKTILDIANTEASSAIVIANSVDAYHYINSDNRRMQDKYVEYCKESRTEPIEILGKDINEITASDYNYAVVVVDPYTIKEEEFTLLQSINYKKILDISTNEFIDLEELYEMSCLPLHM
jgi:hypothetical protein